MYAVALYNNVAETEDELNFNKNDVLEVLQLDYDGLEGWWLCKLGNNMGLAAGNRLKILNLKINNNRNSNTSNTSVLSSCSSSDTNQTNNQNQSRNNVNNNSQESNSNQNSFLDVNTESTMSKSPILNKKLSKSINSSQFLTKSIESILNNCNNNSNRTTSCSSKSNNVTVDADGSDDDYEYDIPSNNKPLIIKPNKASNTVANSSSSSGHGVAIGVNPSYSDDCVSANISNLNLNTNEIKSLKHNSTISTASSASPLTVSNERKSNSPTIDSGISTSSLVSLNEISQSSRTLTPDQIQSYENNINLIAINLRNLISCLIEIQSKHDWHLRSNLEKNLPKIKQSTQQIKKYLNEYYTIILNIKTMYASTYLKLNNYINFKDLCLKLRDFLEKYEFNLNILNNTFNWNLNLLVNNSQNSIVNDELSEILTRLNYLNVLIQTIQDFCIEILFKNLKKLTDSPIVTTTVSSNDDDEGDVYENDTDYWELSETTNETQASVEDALNTNDQILIKFYYKHIDNNFLDIKYNYENLTKISNILTTSGEHQQQYVELFDTCSNRLALNGHKLVFICDTLIRNITSLNIKNYLQTISNNLSDFLKLYVIRIKACGILTTGTSAGNENSSKFTKNNFNILNDSLVQIFNCSNELKEFFLKYI